MTVGEPRETFRRSRTAAMADVHRRRAPHKAVCQQTSTRWHRVRQNVRRRPKPESVLSLAEEPRGEKSEMSENLLGVDARVVANERIAPSCKTPASRIILMCTFSPSRHIRERTCFANASAWMRGLSSRGTCQTCRSYSCRPFPKRWREARRKTPKMTSRRAAADRRVTTTMGHPGASPR